MSSDDALGSHIVWRYSWSSSLVLRQDVSVHTTEIRKKDTPYVTFRVEMENNVPSSSTSPEPNEGIISRRAKVNLAITYHWLSVCWQLFLGPPVLGGYLSGKRHLDEVATPKPGTKHSCQSWCTRKQYFNQTWYAKTPGEASIASFKESKETLRKQFNLSLSLLHPVRKTMSSKYCCPRVMSATGICEPDCMKAARKRPSLSPSLATICSAAEMAPALSPQLSKIRWASKDNTIAKPTKTYMVTFDGSPPNCRIYFWTQRIASRSGGQVVGYGLQNVHISLTIL